MTHCSLAFEAGQAGQTTDAWGEGAELHIRVRAANHGCAQLGILIDAKPTTLPRTAEGQAAIGVAVPSKKSGLIT